jgi:hypothetical protein
MLAIRLRGIVVSQTTNQKVVEDCVSSTRFLIEWIGIVRAQN